MKKKANESPRNYRSFTERFYHSSKQHTKILSKLKLEAFVALYVITIFLILLFSFDLFSNFQRQREIDFQKEKVESEIKLWQNIADKFTNYKEAYYKLAVLEFEIGDIDKAKYYISKALYIDPNFGKARDLEKVLKAY